MRSFILKTLSFSGLLLLMVVLTLMINRYLADFKIEKEKTILILGDSKSACAFNDDLIEGVANFSQLGESYFYSYFKLKQLLEQNTQVNTVLIEISNSQMNKELDRRIWGEKYMPFKFPIYASFMNFEAIKVLYTNGFQEFKSSIVPVIRENLKMLFNGLDYIENIGGHSSLDTHLVDSVILSPEINNELYKTEPDISEIVDFKYLHKIAEFCELKGVKLFLVRSPLHPKYPGFINESQFKKIISQEFSQLEFLDFSQFPISNNGFADLNHLNEHGAALFSKWFNELLNERLFDQNLKQSLINQRIDQSVNLKNNELSN